MKYVIETYDAYDAPSDRKHRVVGRFDDPDKALACAMLVIDSFLRRQLSSGKSVTDATKMFSGFGEVPMILGEPKIEFSPFDYLKARAITLAVEMNKQSATNSAETVLKKPPSKAQYFLSLVSGTNFVERASTIVIIFCSIVVLSWLIFYSGRFSHNNPLTIFEALWPGSQKWNSHPVGWACKGVVLGLVGRFWLTRILEWLRYGKVKGKS